MFIYSNTCGVNNECKTGYSLYFPCVDSITRGENVCFDFYIVDNANGEEVDLREVDDITLNVSGRYNCNFGSFSYPENIKSSQLEKFSEPVYNVDFSDIINCVKLYIDIVDENHKLIESVLFDGSMFLDIAIEGNVGYFLKGSEKYGILRLAGYDTKSYMFLGWDIEEENDECNLENIYDFLIKSKKIEYPINDDCVVRAVYQKRREYTIKMDSNNFHSTFIVDYMGERTTLRGNASITALEGHDVKVSCVPIQEPYKYKFVKWDDGYENPYRVLTVGGESNEILLKAYCELSGVNEEYNDNIDASKLNNFTKLYPVVKDSIYIDKYHINNMYIVNCEIDILNKPYIKIIDSGYIEILNIDKSGNFKLYLDNTGGDCDVYIDNHKVLPSVVDKDEFVFWFDGGIIKLFGKDSCIFGIDIDKEVVYDKGKCMLCFSSENTLNFHPGELVVDGGIIINGNPYGLSPVKFANVTNTTPLVIKNNSL